MHNNLSAKLNHMIAPPVVKLLQKAAKAAARRGDNLYLVGGIVRDLMLSSTCKDIDLMTGGDAIELAKDLSGETGSKPTIHRKFGTASLCYEGYRIDIATCRSETYRRPGALPEVKQGSIRDDLFRRDFTLNAMAINIGPEHYGDTVDLFGGRDDLNDGIIRVLHKKSFQDDATRIMRAIRYEQRLGFKLEAVTLKLLKRDLNMLDTISGERLRNELFLWLGEERPDKILKRADKLGILKQINRGLHWDRNLSIAFKRASNLPAIPDRISLYFCLLAYRLDESGLYELLQRLKLTGSKYDLLTQHTMQVKECRESLMKKALKNSRLYFLLHSHPPVSIQAAALFPNPPVMRSRLNLYLTKLARVKTCTNGTDLARLGIRPGPLTGKILDALLAARLNGKVRTRKDEEKLALSLSPNETRL